MPISLQKGIAAAQEQHYEELYEPEADSNVVLEDTVIEILSLFQNESQGWSQLRSVWMALIFAVVVEPTISYYQPHNLTPQKIIDRLVNWLLKDLAKNLDVKQESNPAFQNEETISINAEKLFTEKPISSFQVLSEALDVYAAALKTLEPNHSLESLLDILDDCLEGYAIFPGSAGRRELFDWWLLDVVPSSWYFIPPDSVDFLDELKNRDGVNYSAAGLGKLEKASSWIWSRFINRSDKSINAENGFVHPFALEELNIFLEELAK